MKISVIDQKLSPLLALEELKHSNELWIKKNQKELSKLPHFNQLKQDLNITKDAKGLLYCEGRLTLAPLPYEAN